MQSEYHDNDEVNIHDEYNLQVFLSKFKIKLLIIERMSYLIGKTSNNSILHQTYLLRQNLNIQK